MAAFVAPVSTHQRQLAGACSTELVISKPCEQQGYQHLKQRVVLAIMYTGNERRCAAAGRTVHRAHGGWPEGEP